jgi:hypothetical protein
MRAEYHRASLLYYSLYYNRIACRRLHPLSCCSPHPQEHVCSISNKLQPAQSVMLQLIPPSISYYHSSHLSATIEFHCHLSYYIVIIILLIRIILVTKPHLHFHTQDENNTKPHFSNRDSNTTKEKKNDSEGTKKQGHM